MGEVLSARLVEISVTKHATESEEKVLRAAHALLPEEIRGNVAWDRFSAHGHYGNPIVLYRATLQGEEAGRVAYHIVRSLDKTSLRYIISTLDSRLDPQGNLYLRLHKQYLLDGKIVAWDGDDVVRVVIKTGMGVRELGDLLKRLLGD